MALVGAGPGILNWALAGLDRLNKRGYLLQPASGCATVRKMEDLASPVGAFVRERCRRSQPRGLGDPTSQARTHTLRRKKRSFSW
jgi:putative DNA primase/helicase